MTVIVLANCPPGLRGFLTRWLLEIAPGVFLGAPTARVRDILWEEVRQYRGKGRALLAYQTNSEQGFAFATHHEGLILLHRPSSKAPPTTGTNGPSPPRQGWSKASKRRRFGNR